MTLPSRVGVALVALVHLYVLLSFAFSVTEDDERIRSPWGSFPGHLGMMARDFNAANEKAWGVGASWYLGPIGLPDLGVYLR